MYNKSLPIGNALINEFIVGVVKFIKHVISRFEQMNGSLIR